MLDQVQALIHNPAPVTNMQKATVSEIKEGDIAGSDTTTITTFNTPYLDPGFSKHYKDAFQNLHEEIGKSSDRVPYASKRITKELPEDTVLKRLVLKIALWRHPRRILT